MAPSLLKSIFLPVATCYFIGFIIISQLALIKCSTENNPKLSCPLFRDTINYGYTTLLKGEQIDSILKYLDGFHDSLLNFLVFSGYIALIAEAVALTYAVFFTPLEVFKAACWSILKGACLLAFIFYMLKTFGNFSELLQKLDEFTVFQYLHKAYDMFMRQIFWGRNNAPNMEM